VSHLLIELFYYNPVRLKQYGTNESDCCSICVGRQIQVLWKCRKYEETEETVLTTKHIIKQK